MAVICASFLVYACVREGKEQLDVTFSQNLVTETRAEDPCENAMTNCVGPYGNPEIKYVTLPDYPNCTFEVKYKMKKCYINGEWKYDIQLLEWAQWPPCQIFQDSLNNALNLGGDYPALYLQRMEKKLLVNLLNIILADPDIYNTIVPCGNGYTTSFGFTVASCIKFCVVKLGPEIGPNGEFTNLKVVKVPCGEACCRTTFDVCINSRGELVIFQSWSSIGTGNCNGQSPLLPCPVNTLHSTTCIPNCQAL